MLRHSAARFQGLWPKAAPVPFQCAVAKSDAKFVPSVVVPNVVDDGLGFGLAVGSRLWRWRLRRLWRGALLWGSRPEGGGGGGGGGGVGAPGGRAPRCWGLCG